MGWDTEVIIIAEEIQSKIIADQIAKRIFLNDSKYYSPESFYIIQEKSKFSIYYSYTRRKYVPYWVIEKISSEFKDIRFTLLGNMLEFICGPAGVTKINNGVIVDSYGITPDRNKRKSILEKPIVNRKHIYEWFKIDGDESKLRNELVNQFPINDCKQNYIDKLININDNRIDKVEIQDQVEWKHQNRFNLIVE